jgi:hypothetical protein
MGGNSFSEKGDTRRFENYHKKRHLWLQLDSDPYNQLSKTLKIN